MCIAETRTIPFLIPLVCTIFSTCGVRWTYARCFLVLKVRYSVWNLMRPSHISLEQFQQRCDPIETINRRDVASLRGRRRAGFARGGMVAALRRAPARLINSASKFPYA